MNSSFDLMMKCDMCYDRSQAGKKPMCAAVCPSGALFFGTREEVASLRPRSRILDRFEFGAQTITTKVKLMVPRDSTELQVDVTGALEAVQEEDPFEEIALEGFL